MSTKQVISFVVLTATILITSLVLTFTLIRPKKLVTQAQQIYAYSFNIGGENDTSIKQTNSNELRLTNAVAFSPSKTTEFSSSFLCFKNTLQDGVEMSNTQNFDYVCAIPFTISNKNQSKLEFNLEVKVDGDNLNSFIDYKVYDFVDKQYKTVGEINNDDYTVISAKMNEINANSSANFCLVAYALNDGAQFIGESVNINILLTVN